MDSTGTALIVLVAIIAVWVWRHRRSPTSSQAEAQLRRICFGNDSQVDRLLDGEMRRAPGISRAEAARRAVRRYERDNH